VTAPDPAVREAAKTAICDALLDHDLAETCFCGECAAGRHVAEMVLAAAYPLIAASVERETEARTREATLIEAADAYDFKNEYAAHFRSWLIVRARSSAPESEKK
jgi:hypothetical protein